MENQLFSPPTPSGKAYEAIQTNLKINIIFKVLGDYSRARLTMESHKSP